MRSTSGQVKTTTDEPRKARYNYSGFGWGIDGCGNRHMTLDGRNVLFVVKPGDCMITAIDNYLDHQNMKKAQ